MTFIICFCLFWLFVRCFSVAFKCLQCFVVPLLLAFPLFLHPSKKKKKKNHPTAPYPSRPHSIPLHPTTLASSSCVFSFSLWRRKVAAACFFSPIKTCCNKGGRPVCSMGGRTCVPFFMLRFLLKVKRTTRKTIHCDYSR